MDFIDQLPTTNDPLTDIIMTICNLKELTDEQSDFISNADKSTLLRIIYVYNKQIKYISGLFIDEDYTSTMQEAREPNRV